MAYQYGMMEQSAAARQTIAAILARKSTGARRRVKKAAKRAGKKAAKHAGKKAAKRAGKKAAKFVKGSAAAKRHMAKLRKMARR